MSFVVGDPSNQIAYGQFRLIKGDPMLMSTVFTVSRVDLKPSVIEVSYRNRIVTLSRYM